MNRSCLHRDSKDPKGAELLVTQDEWSGLLAAASAGAQHPWIQRHSACADLLKDGYRLRFTAPEWTAFVQAVDADECTRQALTASGTALAMSSFQRSSIV